MRKWAWSHVQGLAALEREGVACQPWPGSSSSTWNRTTEHQAEGVGEAGRV